MALQIINNGLFAGDQNAETIYASFEKTKLNFAELWDLTKYQGYKRFNLQLVGLDTTKPESEYIAEAINRGRRVGGSWGGAFTVESRGQAPIFYTATPVSSEKNSPQHTVITELRYYRVHRPGQSFGGTGLRVAPFDVSPAGSTIISGDAQPELFINLGDIGTTNIWTAFNQGDGGSAWHVEGIAIVTAIQQGVSRAWLFTGNDRLGIPEGDWGGSNVTDPDYLAAIEADFTSITAEPVVNPDLYISKSSKKWISASGIQNGILRLTQEDTSFVFNNASQTDLKGFNDSSHLTDLYDGLDVYIRNDGAGSVRLRPEHGEAVVKFAIASDVLVRQGETVHFKLNRPNNRLYYVGYAPEGNRPVPFGALRILKIEANSNSNELQTGDRVVTSNLNNNIYLAFGEYVGGDPMELASYDQSTIDYFDPENP